MVKVGASKVVLASALALTGASFAVGGAYAAPARVLEENAAPLSFGEQQDRIDLQAPVGLAEEVSSDPLGVDLGGLVVLTDGAAVQSSVSGTGVSASAGVVDAGGLQAALTPFLGQPLSQALIRDIRVATIDHYRDSDRPLVSVSVPPQEITTGTVQLIVTVFRLGDVATDGNGWTSAEHVLETVRAEKGEEVDAGQLLEDLNWLNLNPYRNVAAVFEPGQKAGETILTLRSREVKPWQAYLGYQNSGLESSDTNRIIAGFNLANIPATDHLLSYQLTTSPDFWWKDGLFGDVGNADYIAHSGNYFVPLRWRHKLTLQASYIDSNATLTTPFTQAGKTYQAYLEYALPIMTAGDLRYDIYGGAEWKRQETDVSFAGTLVRNTTLDIAQFIAGVRGSVSDPYGATGFDLRVVASPGDLTGNNDDADFVTVTGNPNASADYLYLYGSAQRTTPIETLDSSLNSNLRAQFGEDLAGLEQLAIGGRNTVRGYSELEAAGNFGFSLSNELRLPPLFTLIDLDSGVQDRLVPFLFADAGYVEDDFANTEDWLVGTGLGADYAVTDYISLSGALGVALSKTLETEAGDARAHVSATFRF